MGDIIPPNPEDSENLKSQIPESQISNPPIRGDSKIKIFEIEKLNDEREQFRYRLDDMISLWYHTMIAGGNAKQYTLDNKVTPERHIQIIDKLLQDIKTSANPEQAIKLLLSNNMVLLGRVDEIINLDKK